MPSPRPKPCTSAGIHPFHISFISFLSLKLELELLQVQAVSEKSTPTSAAEAMAPMHRAARTLRRSKPSAPTTSSAVGPATEKFPRSKPNMESEPQTA